ncbi:8-amino-7-oxononanoate synthase [Usitatibacter palustris]|uniref:8-amino-7-oxononanoate synthase n=1 Tax=Usitatibacter palustris TaxID=2732487 RepID=A0A6M4H7C0_9PROT|nr:8-amino-7-oxononanoate synthase [Usitatibacter palustris]QJR13877.1 8-amino-7-oxononanoate synthase [Usitatibacter palustris]
MAALADRLAGGLEAFERGGLRRARHVAQGDAIDFSSNDYLGLSRHPRLIAAAKAAIDAEGVGARASPLVTGYLGIHARAEERFASFTGLPRALLFASGYAANIGILTALADRSAEIFADKLNHACLNDGARLSEARFTRYPHGDLDALEARLAASTATLKVVATDAVFSMDGDVADVPRLLAACERYDAWLVLDDAHGIGVLGATGRGVLEHHAARSPRIVYMATLGKALGGYGAFVAGTPIVIDWLVQRARTYIYSTALPPSVAGAAIAALDVVDSEPHLLAALRRRVAEFRAACEALGVPLAPSTTAIQPVIVGDAARALEISRRLAARNMHVVAIRPPTVPEGTSRLRISLSAVHTRPQVEALAAALAEDLRS